MSLYSRRSSAASSYNELGSANSSRAVSPSASSVSSVSSDAPPPHSPFAGVQSSRASSVHSSHSIQSQSQPAYVDGAHRNDYHFHAAPQRHDSVEVGIERVPSNASDRDSLPSRRNSRAHHRSQEEKDDEQREPVIHAPMPVRPNHINPSWQRSMERIVKRGGYAQPKDATDTDTQERHHSSRLERRESDRDSLPSRRRSPAEEQDEHLFFGSRGRQHSEPIRPVPNFSRHLPHNNNNHSQHMNAHNSHAHTSSTLSIKRKPVPTPPPSASLIEYISLHKKVLERISALQEHAHSYSITRRPSFPSRKKSPHNQRTQDLKAASNEYTFEWLNSFPDPAKHAHFVPTAEEIETLKEAARQLNHVLPEGWAVTQAAVPLDRGRGHSLSGMIKSVRSKTRSRSANELGADHAREWEGAGWGRVSQRTAARYGL